MKSRFLTHLNRFAIAAILAGMIMLAWAWPAEAKIIYTPANVSIDPTHPYSLDVNNDGLADFTIQQTNDDIHSCKQGAGYVDLLTVTPTQGNGEVISPTGYAYAAAMNKGVQVGPQRSFISEAPMAVVKSGYFPILGKCYFLHYTLGDWVNVSKCYLGLSFQTNGETHYGWARLSVQAGYVYITATLTGYAYETIPGQSILAGQTKGAEDDATGAANSTIPDTISPSAALAIPLRVAAQARTLTVLYSFTGGADGGSPRGRLFRDASGNLYGTAEVGGDTSCNPPSGCGAVLKVDATGNESVLHSFVGSPNDGWNPLSGLIADASGNVYGTTVSGGSSNAGTVFRLDTAGNETVLYNFTSSNGHGPHAGVVRDASGNLYGTTFLGGSKCNIAGCGTVFRLSATGKETNPHIFPAAAGDGRYPSAELVLDASGNLYGTTTRGGTAGFGTVFKVDTTNKETVLYSFSGGADGGNPNAGLIQDAAGNLYGTTFSGGSSGNGTVFKVDATGKETVLHSFTGKDGAGPFAVLMRDVAGNLYGTTNSGGDHSFCSGFGCGVVFKLAKTGKATVLHSFTGTDGANPAAGLVQDAAGNLYGTTAAGGPDGFGVVFKLSP